MSLVVGPSRVSTLMEKHRTSIVGRILYYGFAALFGLFIGFLMIGQTETTYFLNGQPIDQRVVFTEDFLLEHIGDLKTNTVIDYDAVISVLLGAKTNLFPSFTISGEIGTVNSINITLLIMTPLFVVFIAFGILLLWRHTLGPEKIKGKT